jgi:hypothetical protein
MKKIPMGQILIQTLNPKCRLYWFLIEFIDWRYSHVGIFDPSCELAPLLPSDWFTYPAPPLPCVNKYRGMYLYSV